MKIVIDNKAYKGTVTIFDRLYLPQVELIEAAKDEVSRVVHEAIERGDKGIASTLLDKPKLPALIACVEKWELSDFPEVVKAIEDIPLSPREETHEIITQIFSAINKVYVGEMEIPNG